MEGRQLALHEAELLAVAQQEAVAQQGRVRLGIDLRELAVLVAHDAGHAGELDELRDGQPRHRGRSRMSCEKSCAAMAMSPASIGGGGCWPWAITGAPAATR